MVPDALSGSNQALATGFLLAEQFVVRLGGGRRL